MKSHLRLITSLHKIIKLYEEGTVFCAFDTETSGIKTDCDHIIEIGGVKFTKEGVIDTYSSLINLKEPLSPFIINLTGITDKELSVAPSVQKVIPEFMAFAGNSVFIAHNAQFDLRFLNSELERLEQSEIKNECIDTLRLSRLMLPENKTWKQTSLASQFNIDTTHAHRAFDDAKVCAELFKILIKLPVPCRKKKISLAEPLQGQLVDHFGTPSG